MRYLIWAMRLFVAAGLVGWTLGVSLILYVVIKQKVTEFPILPAGLIIVSAVAMGLLAKRLKHFFTFKVSDK